VKYPSSSNEAGLLCVSLFKVWEALIHVCFRSQYTRSCVYAITIKCFHALFNIYMQIDKLRKNCLRFVLMLRLFSDHTSFIVRRAHTEWVDCTLFLYCISMVKPPSYLLTTCDPFKQAVLYQVNVSVQYKQITSHSQN